MKNEMLFKVPEFSGGNIPVTEAARIMRKSPQFVRQAMLQDKLPIGTVIKREGSSQYDYYISPYLFWKVTGFIWCK